MSCSPASRSKSGLLDGKIILPFYDHCEYYQLYNQRLPVARISSIMSVTRFGRMQGRSVRRVCTARELPAITRKGKGFRVGTLLTVGDALLKEMKP